jgi:micrococcal nuclease
MNTAKHRMGQMTIFCFFLSLFIVSSAAFCDAWEGKVAGVTDGTYLTVTHDGKGERISLYGIDCPGTRQDFGQKAKELTSTMVLRKVVEVEPVAIDRKGRTKDQYGRTLARVYTEGRKCLNEELVRSGFAWVYNQNCTTPGCKEWKELERGAKRQKIGLWSTPNPIPPWEFRHSKGALIPIYQGDIVKHVFHSSNCEEFDCNSCIAVFKGREQAIRAGYKPCEVCNP